MSRPLRLLSLAILGSVLAAHAASFLPFVSDDALISLRYAERLADGHGLTWNDGEAVEGYSNLAWVLALAGWSGLGGDGVLGLRVLGAVAMLGVVLLLTMRPPGDPSGIGPIASLATLAVAGPVALWTLGGMEQPLLAFGLLAAFCALANGRLVLASIPFALVVLTRPDGALLVGVAALTLLGSGRPGKRSADLIRLTVVPALAVAGQMLFRLATYGDWLPNTARAKISPSVTHTLDGLRYVGEGLIFLGGPVVLGTLCAVAAWRAPRTRRAAAAIGGATIAWTLYVVVVGGDVLPGRRHLVPTLCGLSALTWLGAHLTLTNVRRRALAGGLLLLTGVLQFFDPQLALARSERWEWDGRAIGEVLGRAFASEEPLFAVDAAGCLPYWSRLPSLDMLGLNDAYLAHHRPDDFGQGRLGHELGDGSYLLDRAPDLILFHPPPGGARAVHRGGVEMQADPRFLREYVLGLVVAREEPELVAPVWFRWRSERIGVRFGANEVELPAVALVNDLLRSSSGAAAQPLRPADDGRLELHLRTGAQIRRNGIELTTGRWRARVSPEGSPVRISLIQGAVASPIDKTTPVELEEPGVVAVFLEATAPAQIRRVTLLRDAE